MKIDFVDNSLNIKFNARQIAKTKNLKNGITTHIEILELGKSDIEPLNNSLNKISIRRLYPNLSKEKIDLWENILEFAINNVNSGEMKSFLAIFNNKPCGLMTIQENKKINVIDMVAIPIAKNKKANLTGHTFFKFLFNRAIEKKASSIELEAVKGSPGNPLKLYKALGFNIIENGDRYVSMSSSIANVKLQKQKMANFIKYASCKHPKSIKLDTYLN